MQCRCVRLTGDIGLYVSELEERGHFVQVDLIRLFLVADGVHEDFERFGTVLETCTGKKKKRNKEREDSSIPCVMNPLGIHLSA